MQVWANRCSDARHDSLRESRNDKVENMRNSRNDKNHTIRHCEATCRRSNLTPWKLARFQA
ncbi:MAG: hypothetical protein SOW25_01895 [Helicobacter sp.]|nr:hypothetical protein [Helicobacteraceae bacterium]MDY3113064.1 hypothetical protein [Helicobacter sp.]